MVEQNFKITLPDAVKPRATSQTPVKIRNAKLSIVDVVNLGDNVRLPAGIYAAETALPDGGEFEAAFEVPEQGVMKDVVLSPSEDADGLTEGVETAARRGADDAAGGPLLPVEKIDLTPGADYGSADPAAADGEPDGDGGMQEAIRPRPSTRGITAGTYAGLTGFQESARSGFSRPSASAPSALVSMVTFEPGYQSLMEQNWMPTGGQIFFDPVSIQARKNQWLRLRVQGRPDRNIAIPVSYTEGAAFELEAENQSWRFVLSDADANAALGYLRHKRISELAWLASQHGPIWQAMFDADHDRPITGTIGAYALLLTGGMEQGERRWSWDWSNHFKYSELLVRNPEAPADALAIHGELLARQGRYDEAMENFAELTNRGYPIFSIGLRLVVDRLLSCRSSKVSGFSSKKIEEMVERFGTLSTYVDFDQPILSFTTKENGELGR